MDAISEALAFLEPTVPADEDSLLAAALQAVVPSADDDRVALAKLLRGEIPRAEPEPMEWDGAEPPEASPGRVKRVTRVDIRSCPTRNCPGTVHMSEAVLGWRCGTCRTSYPALPRGG